MPDDATTIADKAWHNAWRNGSDQFLAALNREREGYRQRNLPTELLWSDYRTQSSYEAKTVPSQWRQTYERRGLASIANTIERDALAERLWVKRDPCWRCGTRSDLGCGCK